jgi:hypothetical protein
VQLLGLVALITLEHLEWIDEGRAVKAFGEEGGPILEAVLQEADERVWGRAWTYMTPDEVAHLEKVIRHSREQNPELRSLSFIRMADFAHELPMSISAFREDRGGWARSRRPTGRSTRPAFWGSEPWTWRSEAPSSWVGVCRPWSAIS